MKRRWLGFVIVAVVLTAGIWAYPQLPARVATHWNLRGGPDGYSSRFVAAFVFPLALLALVGLAQILPRIYSKGRNYAKFQDTYWLLINGIVIVAGVMCVAILANGAGAPVSMRRVTPAALGFLFVVVGIYLGRVEPNWFLGFRTPWTLSSDTVWRKTHRLGGWLFVVAGLFFMASAALPDVFFGVPLLVAIAVLVGTPILYSLYLWWQEKRS